MAWFLAPAYDDATQVLRAQRVSGLKARLAGERDLPWTVDASGEAAAVGAKPGEHLASLPGFPRATGTPRLSFTLSTTGPKPAHVSGEVTLEHEYAASEEVVENPAYAEDEAMRADSAERGTVLFGFARPDASPRHEVQVQPPQLAVGVERASHGAPHASR